MVVGLIAEDSDLFVARLTFLGFRASRERTLEGHPVSNSLQICLHSL